MNELESYYNQSSQVGSALGMIQRGEVAQRQGSLAAQEARDDIQEQLTAEKEKTEEEGGGVGMGAGLLSKEGVAVAGKKVLTSATEKARGFIQGKVDEISEAKAGGTLGDIEGTGENLAQTALANATAITNAPVAQAQAQAVNIANPTAQPALGSGNANLSSVIDDDDFLALDPVTIAGGVNRESSSILDRVKSVFNRGGNTQAQGAVDDQLADAGKISAKTMQDLGDKVGVDFGDLSKGDIGEALGNVLGKTGDVSKITSGLGAVGDALDYLGPIGMIAGIGASIAGIFESKKINTELESKANDINEMTDSINSLGGMSFGSISNTALDTSQFRSGGAGLNF